MKPYVTIDKRSKKARKEYYSKLRGTWGELNPVTRSVPSGKIYNRKKDKRKNRRIGREFSDGFDVDFCLQAYTRKDFCRLLDSFWCVMIFFLAGTAGSCFYGKV